MKLAAALSVALVALGGGALLLSGLGGGAAPAPGLSECAEATDDRRAACFERAFAHVATDGRVAETLAELERLVDRGALDDCHLLAHAVAHASVAELGVDRALLLSSGHCRMGYIHGAAELADARAEEGSPPPGVEAAERCARFRQRDLAASCSHGFGHALLRATPERLQDAADGCRLAERHGIHRVPCEAGVMMQHSLEHSRLPEDEFRRAAAAGCQTLASPRLRTRCFRNVGVVAAFVLEHDPARAATLCRRLSDPRARADCLGGARKEIDEARA